MGVDDNIILHILLRLYQERFKIDTKLDKRYLKPGQHIIVCPEIHMKNRFIQRSYELQKRFTGLSCNSGKI